MPERRRREGEPDYVNPSEQSLITKAAKMEFGNPVVDALIRVVLLLAASGSAGYVTSENKNAELVLLKAEVKKVESEQDRKWKSYYSRRREAQGEHVCFEQRFTRLEVRANIEAPACSARQVLEAPDSEPEAAAAPAR